MIIPCFQVTTTESSKVFFKEETEEGEEETFPNFYPTISIDEDPLKRYRYLTCKCFLLYFYWKARLYRQFVAMPTVRNAYVSFLLIY
jgi:hypothetical protein